MLFTGEAATILAQASVTTPVPVEVTRVDFGDGSATSFPPVPPCRTDAVVHHDAVDSPPIVHRFDTPGEHAVTLWARTGCTAVPVRLAPVFVYAFPSAPLDSAQLPICQTDHLELTARLAGVATGHVEFVIDIATVGPACRLQGYPELQLIRAGGAKLATTSRRGLSFCFPALRPHVVVLQPHHPASIDVSYMDIPSGNPPSLSVACPQAVSLGIQLPGSTSVADIPLRITPCDQGQLTVSPVVPGTTTIPFS